MADRGDPLDHVADGENHGLVNLDRECQVVGSLTGQFEVAPTPSVNIFCSSYVWLPDGRQLVVGGHESLYDGEEETNIYDPFTNTWANNVPDMNATNGVPDNQAGRWYPSVTTLGTGEVLTLAGDMTQPGVSNPLPQVYNPNTNTWRDLTNAVNTNLP